MSHHAFRSSLEILVTVRPSHGQPHAIDASKLETKLAEDPFETDLRKAVHGRLDRNGWRESLRQKHAPDRQSLPAS